MHNCVDFCVLSLFVKFLFCVDTLSMTSMPLTQSPGCSDLSSIKEYSQKASYRKSRTSVNMNLPR